MLPAFVPGHPSNSSRLPSVLSLWWRGQCTAEDRNSCHLGSRGGQCVSQFSTSSWNHFLCEANREESVDKGTILGEPSPTAKSYFLGTQWPAPTPMGGLGMAWREEALAFLAAWSWDLLCALSQVPLNGGLDGQSCCWEPTEDAGCPEPKSVAYSTWGSITQKHPKTFFPSNLWSLYLCEIAIGQRQCQWFITFHSTPPHADLSMGFPSSFVQKDLKMMLRGIE